MTCYSGRAGARKRGEPPRAPRRRWRRRCDRSSVQGGNRSPCVCVCACMRARARCTYVCTRVWWRHGCTWREKVPRASERPPSRHLAASRIRPCTGGVHLLRRHRRQSFRVRGETKNGRVVFSTRKERGGKIRGRKAREGGYSEGARRASFQDSSRRPGGETEESALEWI